MIDAAVNLKYSRAKRARQQGALAAATALVSMIIPGADLTVCHRSLSMDSLPKATSENWQ